MEGLAHGFTFARKTVSEPFTSIDLALSGMAEWRRQTMEVN